VDPNPP